MNYFQNYIYGAGNYRKVNISKQGKAFMAMQSFGTGEQYMDSLIEEYHNNAQIKEQIVSQLGNILDNFNYMHSFREGNGRTQREVIRILALAKGCEVLINVMVKMRFISNIWMGLFIQM
ncbi:MULTISPECIES: Fic family protein [Carnobacterium]|uniref:Fic family protein n=1 Tax=Carnobacterium TaxID=2747 RepID=UPI00288DAC97|nr:MULTISPECIES: Fic family protein [Carnobacterium]MDT1940462.1 Fic family protein [Carnobacterium divergens]MDT1942900.1 Fic family protein [Carnobacterium divergens]MDT1948706.1 Fic family protein [Carnobacterium divergens]MDT1951187.1 Fic family protein [Carnobacterium divergens]MDT1956245.1 Fic family protein [Carnobacterium divergens]